MQKPTVCRIALVTVDPAKNNGAVEAPGVIVRTWSDTCVNVKVLNDGPANDWCTSVPFFQTRAELDAAREKREEQWREVNGDVAVPPFIAACWPERV